jgi:peptidoglycan hydrolase CwlO-like protein
MRPRSHLAATLVALVTVGWSMVGTEPRGVAFATDPETELARTQAQLADARAAHQSLQNTLARQRAELAVLQQHSAQLGAALDQARAELEAVTAEHTRVAGLLDQVRAEVAAVEARIVELNAQIARIWPWVKGNETPADPQTTTVRPDRHATPAAPGDARASPERPPSG